MSARNTPVSAALCSARWGERVMAEPKPDVYEAFFSSRSYHEHQSRARFLHVWGTEIVGVFPLCVKFKWYLGELQHFPRVHLVLMRASGGTAAQAGLTKSHRGAGLCLSENKLRGLGMPPTLCLSWFRLQLCRLQTCWGWVVLNTSPGWEEWMDGCGPLSLLVKPFYLT